ncbi:hypothetical protein TBK1r_66600 [Stieleria magnilauensis]|uniref:Uncharacterized protein n=1 Tax=Stieleria magnilauensis TaxID=2527963 RepID=A0ABX5Y015_9BACT|nr:hypothetical protein TBK1r_66600 [Planctomycetes bacterium TBK1r]
MRFLGRRNARKCSARLPQAMGIHALGAKNGLCRYQCQREGNLAPTNPLPARPPPDKVRRRQTNIDLPIKFLPSLQSTSCLARASIGAAIAFTSAETVSLSKTAFQRFK